MEVLHENQDLQSMGSFGNCLPADVTRNPNFGEKRENREIWLGQGDVSNDGDPSSLFYAGDEFPALPDFPCMSSSSSNSSTPAPSTATPATAGGFSSSTGATSVCSSSSSSSSSAASWAVLKSDGEEDYHRHQNIVGREQQHEQGEYDDRMESVDCMNVMDDFDCMGITQLIEDSNEIWDPTPLFEAANTGQDQTPTTITQNHSQLNPFEEFQQQGHHLGELSQSDLQHDDQFLLLDDQADNKELDKMEPVSGLSEDLAVVFFEWLKSNKESITAEELRSIKIKKSTIESAAKRLGGGKEGMKQLLKLILQWVQNHRLHTKRSQDESVLDLTQSDLPGSIAPPQMLPNPELPNLNPNSTQVLNPISPCFNPPPQQPHWISPYGIDPAGIPIAPPPPGPSNFTSMVSYIGGHDPYTQAHQPYHAPPDQYHMLDGSMNSWAGQLATPLSLASSPLAPMHYNSGPDGSLLQAMTPQGFAGHGNGYNPYQFFPGPGDGLARMGSSATKEARKKRMARQRKMFTHHHHRNNHNTINHGNGTQQQMIQGGCIDPNTRIMIGDHDSTGSISHGGWVYWPQTAGSSGAGMAGPPMMGSMQSHQQLQPALAERPGVALPQASQKQAAADKKQGFKPEKNLKFLLQKVLKQSDVGNLGRIVLPKKEAETHLPELEARDGIPIAMEDIGTSRVWNMRYRFWPNNKSRMYLLENTGDFVRSNGLQEGDFIVIYSDVKCGKYMIRGVKVRPHQQGSKPEVAKKPSKAQKTHNSASPAAGTALSPPHAQRQ
uniref:Transcription factor VP-1 homologue n=1 Tax=Fagopyrum esculentum TaxID=3617 RepID=Q7XXN6_FAGES|nr:transcription factor VP-1 homologue [Fagopyrum esculentum]